MLADHDTRNRTDVELNAYGICPFDLHANNAWFWSYLVLEYRNADFSGIIFMNTM
jgi:hypothetical protein